MMQLQGHDIAVCSWSLEPRAMADLIAKVRALALSHLHLSLAELARMDDEQRSGELDRLRASAIQITAGMLHFPDEDYSTIDRIRQTGGLIPDAQWATRRAIMVEVARLARALGLSTVTTHVGFVPPHTAARYPHAIERIREAATILAGQGLQLLMETGQEPAKELLSFLEDLHAPNVGINFDPANMILYGAGDPIEAIRLLGPHIRHVHIKDATASAAPGVEWGREVPFGQGEVGAARFLAALHAVGYTGPLAIEREAGEDRMADIRAAVQTLGST